jgi:hypothetical protein
VLQKSLHITTRRTEFERRTQGLFLLVWRILGPKFRWPSAITKSTIEQISKAFTLRDSWNRRYFLCEILLVAHLITQEEYDEFAPERADSWSNSSEDSDETSSSAEDMALEPESK